jgi:N-acetylglutamate synthase-like GNAT family acetyltransferase
MRDVTIRKMREEDRQQVLLLLGSWNMAPRSPTPEFPDPERTTIIVENTFVADVAGSVVGVASYVLHGVQAAETASLAVDPLWLGSGIGERLQSARLTKMKELGVERIRTEADRPNVVGWYQRKFGYRVVGAVRKKHEFSLANVDFWTVLELDLRTWLPSSKRQESDSARFAKADP